MRKGKGDHEDSRDGRNLDASFRAELYGINRAAERWGGPGPDKVEANKRHRWISVRGGGIRTKLVVHFSFITGEGVCMLSSVPIGAHLTHHCTRQLLHFFCTKLLQVLSKRVSETTDRI